MRSIHGCGGWVLLACWILLSSSADAAEGRVEQRGGKWSLAFEGTPAESVVELIGKRTGLLVVLPASVQQTPISVRVHDLPLEAAVTRLLRALGLTSFIVVYDTDGRAERVTVMSSDTTAPGSPGGRAAVQTPAPKQPEGRPLEEFRHWRHLSREARAAIHERLVQMPRSPEREQLLRQYKREVWGVKDEAETED